MLIALEGHSYSGKTTLLNYLRDKENKNIIAEHDVYAGGIQNYPPFPPTTFQMAKSNVDFFAGLEKRRASDASLYEGDVFLDRSFLSVILFQKFMKLLSVPGQFEAYEHAKELFKELLNESAVVFPDYLIFVSCDSPADYARRQSREISVGLLRSKEALDFFTKEYENICTVFKSHGRLERIISRNGEKSLRENALLIDEKIVDSPAADKQTLIREVMEII